MAAPCLTALTASTVPGLWARRESLFAETSLDLGGLEAIDSAGVAFLVHWTKAIKARDPDATLTLEHVPGQAMRLINTFRLNRFFELVA
ncbi:MAG: STAS domain-containing protein [Succinivibrionaceae bacterium]|nr:STAS domain-containing protein [Succinivibrionaceae bacterium]